MRSALTAAAALTALALLGACDTARELEASRIDGCSDCHGFPPSQLAASGLPHPADATCVSCHSKTVTAENRLIEGGPHFDGKVDLAAHAVPFTGHSAAALADLPSCAVCHGADYGGGPARSCTACHQERLGVADWRENCTFCHGQRDAGWTLELDGLVPAAPPPTVTGSGGQTSANPKVGAHQAHLSGGTWSAPVACGACHAVPDQFFPGSLDHVTGRAEIAFDDVARQGVVDPRYREGSCAVYCHGSTSLLAGGTNPNPAWTSSGAVVCGSCHTLDPQSGYHPLHQAEAVACGKCHGGLTLDPGAVPTTVDVTTHLNGTFEATIEASAVTSAATFSSWPLACSDCHPSGPPPF